MVSQVVFRGGQLLCGVLDKSQFGASQFGFVHSCQELYGGNVANQLLSALGCLFTAFLQLHGFSLGVEDILVKPEVVLCLNSVCWPWSVSVSLQADQLRKEHLQGLRECGQAAVAEAFSLPPSSTVEDVQLKYETAHRSADPASMKSLDYCFSHATSKYNNLINMWV